MIADTLMALVVALFFEMLSLSNKLLKLTMIIVCCICLIAIYFGRGCQIDFIGEMDLAIWILFVVMFDKVLMLIENGKE